MNAIATPISNQKKKPQDFKNGHQTILKTFVRDKTLIEIEFADGTAQKGRVTQFDNYTITIMRVAGDMGLKDMVLKDMGYRTYFKSSIKGFGAAANV